MPAQVVAHEKVAEVHDSSSMQDSQALTFSSNPASSSDCVSQRERHAPTS